MTQITELPAPNIKYFSEKEIDNIRERVNVLLEKNDDLGLAKMVEEYPISAKVLDGLKRRFGLKYLLQHRVNLANAVKEYGESWLEQ